MSPSQLNTSLRTSIIGLGLLILMVATTTASTSPLPTTPFLICARGDTSVAPENTLAAMVSCYVKRCTIWSVHANETVWLNGNPMRLTDGSFVQNHDEQVVFNSATKTLIYNPTAADTRRYGTIDIRSHNRSEVSTWRVLDRSTNLIAPFTFSDQLLDAFNVIQVELLNPTSPTFLQDFIAGLFFALSTAPVQGAEVIALAATAKLKPFKLDLDIKDDFYVPEPPSNPYAFGELLSSFSNEEISTSSQVVNAVDQLDSFLVENLPLDLTSNGIVALTSNYPAIFPHLWFEADNTVIVIDIIHLCRKSASSIVQAADISFNYNDLGSGVLDALEIGPLESTGLLELKYGLNKAIFFPGFYNTSSGANVVPIYKALGIETIAVLNSNSDVSTAAAYGFDGAYYSFPPTTSV